MEWQLHEAKARFSELVQKAIDEGPQTVTRRGRASVVVVDVVEFDRLKGRRLHLKEVLVSGPEGELELPERLPEPPRDVPW